MRLRKGRCLVGTFVMSPLLQHLADSIPLHIHIHRHNLGGGDPLAIVELSDAKLNATGRDFCQIWCD